MLVFPEKYILPYSFILINLCSNNVAEYQALILGLQMITGMGIKDLDVYGDRQLVINWLLEEFEVKKDDLVPHYKNALQLLDKLQIIKLEHVRRIANEMADALANLATTLALGQKKASPYGFMVNESSHLQKMEIKKRSKQSLPINYTKKSCASRSSITWNTESCQASRGIK